MKYTIRYDLPHPYNERLHRVEALKDFGEIKRGYVGGFIESEQNLSQYGSCFVYHNAIVKESAKVEGKARVMSNATVKGEAVVNKSAVVTGDGMISGQALVTDNAIVSNRHISGNTIVNRVRPTRLTHYSSKDFVFDPNRQYPRQQLIGLWLHEGDDWKNWITDNRPDSANQVEKRIDFRLTTETNLFAIDTPGAVMALPVKEFHPPFSLTKVVDWGTLKDEYSALYVSKEMIEWAKAIPEGTEEAKDPRIHFVAARGVQCWCIWFPPMVEEVTRDGE